MAEETNATPSTNVGLASATAASRSMAPTAASGKKRKSSSSLAADAAAAVSNASSPPSPTSSRPRTSSSNKSGGAHSSTASAAALAKESREQLHADLSYTPLSLQDIHDRFKLLCYKVPVVPDGGFTTSSGGKQEPEQQEEPLDTKALKEWAMSMQTVVEELSILMGCVYPATYVWGTDRSGAADQNLALLNNELARSQDYIATLVTPRLTDVLTPAMSLVTKKTVTTKDEGTGAEIKVNHFETTPEDPNYVQYGLGVLARNAPMLRHVVIANIDKMLQAIKDYLSAQQKDAQHDSRGFVY